MTNEEEAKVIGEIEGEDAIGILGHNMAESGKAIGVKGRTESNEGYGFYTEANAYIGGTLFAGGFVEQSSNDSWPKSGTLIPFQSLSFGPHDTTITSTEFVRIGGESNRIAIDFDSLPDNGISRYHIELTIPVLMNLFGEISIRVKYGTETGAEISVSQSRTMMLSAKEEFVPPDGTSLIQLEGKVSEEEGEMSGIPVVTIYGEIE